MSEQPTDGARRGATGFVLAIAVAPTSASAQGRPGITADRTTTADRAAAAAISPFLRPDLGAA